MLFSRDVYARRAQKNKRFSFWNKLIFDTGTMRNKKSKAVPLLEVPAHKRQAIFRFALTPGVALLPAN